MTMGIEYILKHKYVPKTGDVIIDSDYPSWSLLSTFVKVEREHGIPEPVGDVVIIFESDTYARPTFASSEIGNHSGRRVWYVYTWRANEQADGMVWGDFVKHNKITAITAVYRKE